MRTIGRAVAVTLLAACAPAAPTVEPPKPIASASAAPSASTRTETPGVLDASTAQNLLFEDLSARFVRGYFQRSPVAATVAGFHDHDGRWPDVSAEGDAEWLAFLAATRKELAAIARDKLSEQNQVDAAILATELDRLELTTNELRPAETNPRFYTELIGDAFDALTTREFAPLAERMKSIRARLASLPALVVVARKRLASPARIHTETAIRQTKGLIPLVEKEIVADAKRVPEERAAVEAAAKTAAAALRDYQAFLEKDLLARSTGSFRVGRAKLEKILRLDLDDDVATDDLAAGARALLAKTHAAMVETAKEIWPTIAKAPLPPSTTPAEKRALIKSVLDKLAEDRSDNKTILADAKKLLDDATAFVKSEDIVRVPDEPCRVIEMPEYRRGVTIAYSDSTGPFEKKQESVYAIAPPPSDWPAKRAASFYREYNRSMLADLTVHEAMPGHYLQGMHSNRLLSRESTHGELRALFASGPFVEGWAVYAESVMAKHGFGGAKVRFEHQKMVLRLCVNAILDHDIHAGTMEEKEALAMMMDDAFQEEGEAVAKWARARLTAGQLTTYYYGFTEMLKLRAAAEQAPGFKERAYHDKLLSFGSPSMRHARRLMLGQ
jgi:uncharacterized protein (DUF885 family)